MPSSSSAVRREYPTTSATTTAVSFRSDGAVGTMRFRLDAEFGTRDFGDRFHRAETRNSVWRPSRVQVVAPGETVALAAMPPFTAISLESGLGGNEYPPTNSHREKALMTDGRGILLGQQF